MKKNILKKVFASVAVLGVAGFAASSLTSCGSNEAIKIGIPSDGTNLSRGIKLLESAGLIKVDPAAGYTPEIKDITEYVYNVEIVPTTANTLPNLLDDYGACAINGTYAIPQGLIPSKDALIIEKQDESGNNPYVNIIAARTADKDNATYKKVVDAFHSQIVAEYLLTKYSEAFFPSFEYSTFTSEQGSSTVTTIDEYNSSSEGKTTIKVGVCGSSNSHWNAVQYVLDQQNAGIYIQLVEFSAYNLPNEALNSGDIDLNAFQHIAYLNSECTDNNFDITSIGDTLIAPLSLYSHQYSSLDALKDAAGLKK